MDYLYLACFLIGYAGCAATEWFLGPIGWLKSKGPKRQDGPVPPPPPK